MIGKIQAWLRKFARRISRRPKDLIGLIPSAAVVEYLEWIVERHWVTKALISFAISTIISIALDISPRGQAFVLAHDRVILWLCAAIVLTLIITFIGVMAILFHTIIIYLLYNIYENYSSDPPLREGVLLIATISFFMLLALDVVQRLIEKSGFRMKKLRSMPGVYLNALVFYVALQEFLISESTTYGVLLLVILGAGVGGLLEEAGGLLEEFISEDYRRACDWVAYLMNQPAPFVYLAWRASLWAIDDPSFVTISMCALTVFVALVSSLLPISEIFMLITNPRRFLDELR